MAVTLKDIAERAGKSVCAVSVVLNGSCGSPVSEATRMKILSIAEKLGYKAHPRSGAGRGRRGKKGGIPRRIGIIAYSRHDWGWLYHTLMAEAVRSEIVASGYEVAFLHSISELEDDRLFRRAFRDLGGLISTQFLGHGEEVCRFLDRVPRIAHIGGSTYLNERVTNITINYAKAVRTSIEHLKNLGHRRIAYIISSNPESPRVSEYLRLMSQPEFDWDERYLVNCSNPLPELTCANFVNRALDALTALEQPPTAILTFDDEVSVETLRLARQRGLRVPEDLAIVGFDTTGSGARTHPGITAVQLPRKKMAQAATKMMIEQIEHNSVSPMTVFIPTELVIRESCGCKVPKFAYG